MRAIIALGALSLAVPATAQLYSMKMRTILGADGTVAFGCISQPFVGAVAFIPDPAYRSGVAVIVVPEVGYRAFLNRRYAAPWYLAAEADYAAGRQFTRAVRAFLQSTGRTTTVAYEAEGSTFGSIGNGRVPVNSNRSDADLFEVDAAIGNCSLSGNRRRGG